MELPDFLAKMLNEIAMAESFTKYRLETKAGSNQGDNYSGVMTAVAVIGDRVKNGVEISDSLNLICKLAPASKERREAFFSVSTFKREISIYTKLLPTFVAFQQEKGLAADESFLSFPKVYAWLEDDVNETYAMIMEDMRLKDFVMWPRQDAVPLSHEELIFTQLGRFHGVSFALKDQRPEVFEEFKKLGDIFTIAMKTGKLDEMIESAIDRALGALKNDKHKELVRGMKKNYGSLLEESCTPESIERFGVINHADCWINNFMFQYDKNSKELKDVCFLDWQNGRYASPALDVLYHIFTSTRKELRDKSYDDLLHIYHKALSDTVRKLGSDPERLFKFSDLLSELKANGNFALAMGVLVVSFVLVKQDDVCDLDDYAKRSARGEDVTFFSCSGEESDAYIQVINDLIGDIVAYGYNH